jgi:indole-3-glycerol phosphate synthase
MNFLSEILAVKKEEVEKLKKQYSFNSFKETDLFYKKSLNFYADVKSSSGIAIIAEIKKASPSKGIIRDDFDYLSIAKSYFNQSVNAVSILTDKNFFMGHISYLNDIARIKTAPLLRKDFIIDEIQIYEAKANGADLILLICEALSKELIRDFTCVSKELGLEILLELHSEKQLDKIDFDLNKIIGVNNRNLENFKTDISTTQRISNHLPADVLLVSESGISKKEDVNYIRSAGVDAILVGEHLMRSGNIELKLSELKSWCANNAS